MTTTAVDTSLFTVRAVTVADADFILATWLRGLRYGNEWFELIPSPVFFSVYQQVIETILKNPRTTIKIACLKDDPEVILGYSIANDHVLHWVFVKKAWRKIGIAKALVSEGTTTVTHLTNIGKSIIKKQKWVFNPFLVNL